MNYILVLAIVLVLYFFPDYTKHTLLLSSLVVILAFRNKASLNARRIPWIDRYDALVEWMNAHGGAWPRYLQRLGRLSSMSEADAEEHRYAQWVHNQRTRGPASLSLEVEARDGLSRAELLERLEGWAWREVESWMSRYDGLVAWMSAHGGAWPRQRHCLGRRSSMSEGDAEEHRHALWVQKQRGQGRACLSGKVEGREGVSRSELLERLDGWAWREQEQEVWMSRYDALVAWMSAHGGAWPRHRHQLGRMSSMSEADAEEHRLAKWVHEQRSERARGRMQEIESTSEGDISRGELFERLLRPQPAPLSRPIDLSVEPLSYSPEPQRPEPLSYSPEPQRPEPLFFPPEPQDRMKRRRVEEEDEEAANIMRGWVMEERRSGR